MKFAIPTHRRPAILIENTLSYLAEVGVEPKEVDLFLSDMEDYDSYKRIKGPKKIVTEARDVREKFNYIHQFYKKGERVVVLEDDITLIDSKNKTFKHFKAACKLGFKEIRKKSKNGGIWAVNPSGNHYFIQNKVTSDKLKLCVAHCYGFISEPENRSLLVRGLSKGDYERTIRYYMNYDFVVRVDYCGVKTKSYVNEGGMQANPAFQRERHESHACKWLQQVTRGIVSINENRKSSKYMELKMKNVKSLSHNIRKTILNDMDRK